MNTVDVLMYGQRTIMTTVHRFAPDDWGRIALGVWTAKDLLGHLGAFEARFADVLATFVDAPVETDLLGVDPGLLLGRPGPSTGRDGSPEARRL